MIDLTTLYILAALASIVAGIVHVVPWATGRFGGWAPWWGFGHVAMGMTAVGAVLRDHGAQDWIIRLGNPLAILAYAAIFAGMRSFDDPRSRNLPVIALAALIAAPLFFWVDPADFAQRIACLCLFRSLFDIATVVVAVRIARREHLHTGWIVATLFAITVPLFVARGWLTATDRIGASLTGRHDDAGAWLAAAQIAFILFRGFSLFVMEAERGQRTLADLADRDSLTAALNRGGFQRRRDRWQGDGAVMMIDLDCFKALNDTCGHAAGDAMLCLLANVARDAMPADAALCRWGGDEFVCVLPGMSADHARDVAARIMARFAADGARIAPGVIGVVPSIGIASGSLAEMTTLIAEADMRMYAEKAQRRSWRDEHSTHDDTWQRSVAENDPAIGLISHLQHG